MRTYKSWCLTLIQGAIILGRSLATAAAATDLGPIPTLQQNMLDQAVSQTLTAFADKALRTNQLAVTFIDLRDSARPLKASYRGESQVYPASVVKLFFLVAAHEWLERGNLSESQELRRALREMIVDSYNEATHYVVDSVTGTTSGPELSPTQMADWVERRNMMNRYFSGLGYKGINVNQKPWCEGPYGRERVFVGERYENRNQLTTDATASLLAEIVLGKAVSATRSMEMMKLLERNPFAHTAEPDDQAHGFTGAALPPSSKLWSKAGWTSETRHDAAYVELPDGWKFVLVTFTTGHANDREIIPFLAKSLIAQLAR